MRLLFPTLSTHFPSQDALPMSPSSQPPPPGPFPRSERWSPSLSHGCRLLSTRRGSLVLPTPVQSQPQFFNQVEGEG